jgi:iron(III) transport system permease protein
MRGLLLVLGGVARLASAALVVVPLAALGLAAVIDRGPAREVGATPFHLALGILDPFARACAFNSLLVAAAVSAGSLVVGAGLSGLIVRWRFWGRAPLAALVMASLAVPPLVGAIGVDRLLERSGVSALAPRAPASWGGWLALVWLGLASGVPWVALRTRAAWERIDPDWIDAARTAGAGRRRIAVSLVWPIVRPSAARGVADVFAWTLLEPGAPWLLGMRRTLAFQVIDLAHSPGGPPRVAALGLVALVLAWAGRTLILWRGGPLPALPEAAVVRPRRAAAGQGALFAALLGGWVALAYAPILATIGAAFVDAGDRSAATSPLRDLAGSAEVRQLVENSFLLGLAVVAIDLGLALALTSPRRPRSKRRRGLPLAQWPRSVPPLTLGIGALLVPWVLGEVADGLAAAGGHEVLAARLRGVAEGLDPYRSPGVLLAWAVALARLPWVARAVESARRRRRAVLAEAALTLGASRRRAWWTATAPALRSALAGPLLLAWALAVGESSSALILTPTSASRTIGPGVALLAHEPGGLRRAATLGVVLAAVNLAAFALAGRADDGAGTPSL